MFATTSALITIPFLQKKLRDGIKHASLICHNHEDTRECKLAWDRVEDIQKAINKKKNTESKSIPGDKQCEFDPLACREYDV